MDTKSFEINAYVHNDNVNILTFQQTCTLVCGLLQTSSKHKTFKAYGVVIKSAGVHPILALSSGDHKYVKFPYFSACACAWPVGLTLCVSRDVGIEVTV